MRKIPIAFFVQLGLHWLQFATYTPMMRSNGTDIPREIYQFGKKGESDGTVLILKLWKFIIQLV